MNDSKWWLDWSFVASVAIFVASNIWLWETVARDRERWDLHRQIPRRVRTSLVVGVVAASVLIGRDALAGSADLFSLEWPRSTILRAIEVVAVFGLKGVMAPMVTGLSLCAIIIAFGAKGTIHIPDVVGPLLDHFIGYSPEWLEIAYLVVTMLLFGGLTIRDAADS